MSHFTPNAEIDAIAGDVEAYVDSHPAAADTVAGIQRWWLRRPIAPPVDLVEAAVNSLVRRGVLSRRVLPDGNIVYARPARPTGA